MIRSLPALLFAAFLTACTQPAPAPPEPVLLTVLAPGAQGEAPQDGLFAVYGVEGQAVSFTRSELDALGRHGVRADYPLDSPPRLFEGPRLSAVLAAAGAAGADALITAADGYQVRVEADMIAAYEPVLALDANGEPLGFGSLGPLMLVWPRQDVEALFDMNDDLWPWAVFAVEAID